MHNSFFMGENIKSAARIDLRIYSVFLWMVVGWWRRRQEQHEQQSCVIICIKFSNGREKKNSLALQGGRLHVSPQFMRLKFE